MTEPTNDERNELADITVAWMDERFGTTAGAQLVEGVIVLHNNGYDGGRMGFHHIDIDVVRRTEDDWWEIYFDQETSPGWLGERKALVLTGSSHITGQLFGLDRVSSPQVPVSG